MNGNITDSIEAVLKLVQGARQVQVRHSVLIRNEIRRMVTGDEFNTAMATLGDTLTGLEEELRARSDRLEALLATLIERRT